MNKLTIRFCVLTFLSISMITCWGNNLISHTARIKTGFGVSSQLPDTSAKKVDSIHKISAVTDTGWSKTARPLTNEQKKKNPKVIKINPVKPGTKATPLQGGKMIMNPLRPQELQDGIKKAQEGDLKGAAADFSTVIQKNPKNYYAFFYRAKAEVEMGDTKSAMADINQAIQIKGNEALYYYYRGKMYSDQGESGLAMLDFNKALELRRDFTDAFNYRGVERAKQGNNLEAIRDYDSAININPKYPVCYYNKGTSQATLGDYKAAIESFTTAISLDSLHKLSYMNRGNCYVQLNDLKSAIADYTKVIKIDPKYSDAYYNRGAAYYLSDDKAMCQDWKTAALLGNAKAKTMIEKNCK